VNSPITITYESRQVLTHDAPFRAFTWQYRAVCGRHTGAWRATEEEALENWTKRFAQDDDFEDGEYPDPEREVRERQREYDWSFTVTER
jgi:N-dimethylarginine dimethylaminohydrolase